MSDHRWRALVLRSLAGLSMAGGAAWLGLGAGCATYANYPEIGSDAAVNDPNMAPLPTLMTVSVGWVASHYPVDGDYVVNWPRGTEEKRAMTMTERVGEGARVVSDDTTGLPVFHVSRVWLRGDRGEVDVMRPVGGSGGGHQTVTVHMKSHFGRWDVSSTKAWPVGIVEVPDLYGWEFDD